MLVIILKIRNDVSVSLCSCKCWIVATCNLKCMEKSRSSRVFYVNLLLDYIARRKKCLITIWNLEVGILSTQLNYVAKIQHLYHIFLCWRILYQHLFSGYWECLNSLWIWGTQKTSWPDNSHLCFWSQFWQ